MRMVSDTGPFSLFPFRPAGYSVGHQDQGSVAKHFDDSESFELEKRFRENCNIVTLTREPNVLNLDSEPSEPSQLSKPNLSPIWLMKVNHRSSLNGSVHSRYTSAFI